MPAPLVIAIDGPVASGKTAVGLALAKHLGYRFVDTGVMYRAVAWLAKDNEVDATDEKAIGALAQAMTIEVLLAGEQRVLVNGTDVTGELRRPEVEEAVSYVAQFKAVRDVMVAQQRRMASEGRLVMAGRDIGTIVLPDAPLKIYLTASDQERARRRHDEMAAAGWTPSLEAVAAGLAQRDALDSQRVIAPLRPAPDAAQLDTDGLDVAAVVQCILALADGI